MKRSTGTRFLLSCFAAVILSSCDKGYEVRVTNYYTEAMDSVVIGNNKIVFKDIQPEATTGFEKLAKGEYYIRFISKSKTNIISKFIIPKTGTGKRTIQIDGIKQVSILEE